MQRHLLGWINRGMVEKARQDLETNIRQIRVDDRGEAYMSHRENQEASVSSYVYTGSSGDMFVVRTSKPVENLWKNGLFWSRHFRKLLEVARFSLRDVTMAKIVRTNKLPSSPPPPPWQGPPGFAFVCEGSAPQGPEEFRVNKWITYLEKCLYLSLSTIN